MANSIIDKDGKSIDASEATVPSDRHFRGAWVIDGKTISEDITEAKKIFKESEKLEEIIKDRPTNPSKIYIERCNYFQKNSPGKDWDGIWTMKTK